ncbi:MAG: GTPase HflX [Desulfurococcales archaeon]|nr:GTPase HflX [Desulfurococcales archaeon]MCE4605358.1 GTPase HflX [Desulfurococcales archaeon]
MDKAVLIIPRIMESHIDEALALAETAGYRIVWTTRTRHPRRVGRGLVEEVASRASEYGVEAVIFYGDIQPSSRFLLMKATRARVLDRVMLILEIFARHAGSREAKLQIEMARIRHEIPMVRELIRRSKMGEYPGFLGPGGYAVDSYYRHLTKRLARIRRELEELRRVRGQRFRSRSRSGMAHVSIIGYASAGKTSLFNRITGESKPVGPEYFTTLHPKHKAVNVRGSRIAFVDTVGFIRDVPPEVIEAFYSTLEEITMSDAAIFVIDSSEPVSYIREKLTAGLETLAKIGAHGLPIILAANKVDLVPPGELKNRIKLIEGLARDLSQGSIESIIPVSARTGQGINILLEAVVEVAGSAPKAGRPVW